MKWYWWLIGEIYLAIALIITIFVIIIAIKSEWETNICSTKPDQWGFVKNCWSYIIGSILFGLAWLYYFIIDPLIQRKKEVREMRWFLELACWVILLVLVLFMLLTWPAERIIFVFLGYYFVYGMILGLELELDSESKGLLFFKTILWGVAWPVLLVFFLIGKIIWRVS